VHQVVLFLAETFFSLLLYVFLLRVVLQWARANFRNPISEAIVRLSNWLVIPLRRVLPPVWRIDTASLIAVYAVALVQTAALSVVLVGTLPDALPWLLAAATELLRSALWLSTPLPGCAHRCRTYSNRYANRCSSASAVLFLPLVDSIFHRCGPVSSFRCC